MPNDAKAVVRGYLEEIVTRGRMEAWDRYFDPEVRFNGRPLGPADMAGMREVIVRAFPDFQLSVEQQVGEVDAVATRVVFRGTHLGDYRGLRATGRTIEYGGAAFDRLEGGRVVEMWHVTDDRALLRQLGVDWPLG